MGMTKAERTELGALIRKREKVMKAKAEERSAALLAEFEAEMTKIFAWDDDPVWEQAYASVAQAMAEANTQIDRRCEQLGIPKEFRPQILHHWLGRRENGVPARQIELRRTAKAKIAAIEKEAMSHIETMSLDAQTTVISSGLETPAARDFLEKMPPLEALMPSIDVAEIQALLETKAKPRNRLASYDA